MPDKNIKEILGSVGLFSSLSPRYLKVLADSCTERSYNADDLIVEQGAQGVGLMIIASGSVQVRKKLASGEQIQIATLKAGEFFGEISVLDDAPRTANVVALEAVDCLVLSSWSFTAAMKSNPEIGVEMLAVILKRYRETSEALSEVKGAANATD